MSDGAAVYEKPQELEPVTPDESDRKLRANICFDCQRATGGCSWSEIDPETGKPRFKPVPGWQAELIVRKFWGKTDVTWQVTGCPLFIRDEPRKMGKKELNMGNRKPGWDAHRAEELMQEGYSDLQVAEMVGASVGAVKSWKQRRRKTEVTAENKAEQAINDVKDAGGVEPDREGDQTETMKLSALLPILQQVHAALGDEAEITGEISTCRSAMLYARLDRTGQLRSVRLRLLPEEV